MRPLSLIFLANDKGQLSENGILTSDMHIEWQSLSSNATVSTAERKIRGIAHSAEEVALNLAGPGTLVQLYEVTNHNKKRRSVRMANTQ